MGLVRDCFQRSMISIDFFQSRQHLQIGLMCTIEITPADQSFVHFDKQCDRVEIVPQFMI